MRIAVLDDYQRVAESLADWARLDAEIEFFSEHIADETELVRRLAGFEVLVAMRERTPFPQTVLQDLPDLRLLITTGSNNASIDLRAAHELGILALARGLLTEVDSVRKGGWQRGLGRDLLGSTLGVIGLGRLGSQVARLGLAFGMDVLSWSQNLTRERAAEVEVSLVSRDELLGRSDFVTIHLKLSPRTVSMIGEPELSLMKPSAYLVNTSRGPIIDEVALLAAVRGGVIAGAALDVFEREPLPDDHPFRTEARILATPHIGYVTRESYQVFYEGVVEAIEAWRDGDPIRLLT
jgi:phosphoglycerate dehydrogenase-like enzyme